MKRFIKIAIQRWLALLMLALGMATPIVEVVREPDLLHNVFLVVLLTLVEVTLGLLIWLIFRCCDPEGGSDP